MFKTVPMAWLERAILTILTRLVLFSNSKKSYILKNALHKVLKTIDVI